MQNQIPRGPDNLYCPDWKKPMSRVCHTCPLWIQVRGKNPQTDAEIDAWNCAKAWLPTLLVENSQQTRQGAAATESLRNLLVLAQRERVKSIPITGGRIE